MATEIYLGNPPPHIIDWIKAHSKPAGNPKTKITFTDGTSQEYEWSGEITQQMMIDAELYFDYTWIKNPQTVEIGTNVTSIGSGVFDNCRSLTGVTIPDSMTSIKTSAFNWCTGLTNITIPASVTSIGIAAFSGCSSLTDVTFLGKDKATVKGMANYSWSLKNNCVIHCTDGDILITINNGSSN